jgi:hypothetical protein
MALGATPQNQLNALPLVTAAQFTGQVVDPGELSIVGGSVVRYWSATRLALNGVNFATVGTRSALLTPFLDFTGMNQFQVIMVRECLSAGGDLAESMSIYAQSNVGTGDNPLGVGGGAGSLFAVGCVSVTMIIRGGPYPQSTVQSNFGWTNGTLNGIGPSLQRTMGRARLWFDRPAVANADQRYTISLWAQS